MYRPLTPCRYCGKLHGGVCLFGQGRCYECGELGHKKSECPKLVGEPNKAPPPAGLPRPPTAPPRAPNPPSRGRPPVTGPAPRTRGSNKPQAGGRVYCLKADEEGDEDPHAVISGMLFVNAIPVIVLFDAGATHSFINPDTASRMDCECTELDVQLHVTTPVGSIYHTERVARNCAIIISGRLFQGDLILLGIRGYDVILGMDWLTQHQATIDCNKKTLTLTTSEGERIQYKGGDSTTTISVISSAKACKLIRKGCAAYLCAVKAGDTLEPDLNSIPVAQNFPQVFQEVPGLPLTGRLNFL